MGRYRYRYRKIKRPLPPPAAPAARDLPAPQDSGRTGRGTGACAGRGLPRLPGGLMHTQGVLMRLAELPGGAGFNAAADALRTKRVQRWRRGAGREARRVTPWEARDALGVHAGRRTAFPPHSLAARRRDAGSGPDDGCRGRFSDPPGAVRRRTRQRRPGGHAPERSGAGPLPVSDAGGSSG